MSYEIERNWLKVAYQTAQLSPDPSTQNGCIIVHDNDGEFSYGWNRMPSGLAVSKEQWADRTYKYAHVVHAEVAAIMDAAKYGRSCHHAVMFGTWVSCRKCAGLIIESGISAVIGHKLAIHETHAHWKTDIDKAKSMFQKAGVLFVEIEGPIGAKIRFNYNEVTV